MVGLWHSYCIINIHNKQDQFQKNMSLYFVSLAFGAVLSLVSNLHSSSLLILGCCFLVFILNLLKELITKNKTTCRFDLCFTQSAAMFNFYHCKASLSDTIKHIESKWIQSVHRLFWNAQIKSNRLKNFIDVILKRGSRAALAALLH